MTDTATSDVRSYLVESHAGVVEAVRECAAASASAGTDGTGRSDTAAVRRGIEVCLRERGVWDELPSVLAGCVERAGGTLRASPVAAPPYVAPTATGVVLRATLDAERLVVAVDALAVSRGSDREGTDGGTGAGADEDTGAGVTLRPRPPDTPPIELVRVEWRT